MTTNFIVKGWSVFGNDVRLTYQSGEFSFTETVSFPVSVHTTPVVKRLLDLLAVIAGVSYAKAFAPVSVSFPTLDLSEGGFALAELTYNEGMREFAFQNNLPLTNAFVINDVPRGENFLSEPRSHPGSPLIPFGAGRDSCVVAAALKHLHPTLFTIGENAYAEPIAQELSLPFLKASRTLDPLLLQMNESGAPNGHIPVTAINSLISIIVANLTDHTSVVMANEKSASQPTRTIDGIEINHQFSKSLHYENALSRAVEMAGCFVVYGSALRDSPDADISRAFATKCVSLHPLFMSCNQAMLRDPHRRSDGWCGNCPKCRGMYLSLAPFLTPAHLTAIFGTDLLDDDTQSDGFLELLSDESKPFECVADVREAKESMRKLLTSSLWSNHSVVLACADAARQRHSSKSRDDFDWSWGMFDNEIQEFLDATA